MDFDKAFDLLMEHEVGGHPNGGYVNHPRDPGGETKWGITKRTARKHGYQGDMRDLSREKAKEIARAEYWKDVYADDLPACVRFDVFDTCYHSGAPQTIKLLQRAAGVDDDGICGPKTRAAIQAMNGYQLLARFNGHRLLFLSNLKTWDTFGEGWAKRVARNLIAAGV